MLVFQTNPGVENFSYAKTSFYFNNYAQMLTMSMKTLSRL